MKRAIATAAAALTLLAGGASAAQADGGRRVEREGPCSANSDWKLRVENRDGGLRVRWEADSGIPGQSWQMRLRQNGDLIASAVRRTNADGEAQLNLTAQNRPGPDAFRGTATNTATGETCSGSVTF